MPERPHAGSTGPYATWMDCRREGERMRSQPLPNLLATPYVFHRLEPVTERLATEQLPAVLDADLKTWYLNQTATLLAPHLLEFYRRDRKSTRLNSSHLVISY